MEATCPACGSPMERVERGAAGFWRCASCGAHALTFETLRKVMPREVWSEVWPAIRRASASSARRCPSCGHGMEETTGLERFGALRLDVCDRCRLLFLDPTELAALPKSPLPEEDALPPEVREAIARAQVSLIKERHMCAPAECGRKMLARTTAFLMARVAGEKRFEKSLTESADGVTIAPGE